VRSYGVRGADPSRGCQSTSSSPTSASAPKRSTRWRPGLLAISPVIRLVLLTDGRDDATLPSLHRIDPTWPAADLVAAVRTRHATTGFPPWTTAAVRLSDREREVLALVSEGSPKRPDRSRLCLSPHTTKRHTSSAYRKLRVRNRAEAVTRARAVGLIR
jgi:DNA-binding CsgD family transcriptional regulator